MQDGLTRSPTAEATGARRQPGSRPVPGRNRDEHAGVVQMVERQPSKLYVAGSKPAARSIIRVPETVS